VAILETEIVPIETPTSFLQWTPVIAGALVASALSLVLIAFGSGLSIGAPKRRDPRFCHRCIFTGRGRCDLVRSLRWRTASGRCPSGSYVALAATRLGAQTNRAERIGELARCYQFRWKPALA
jgi:hypothetical protein